METTPREWKTEAITDTETAIGNLEVGQQDIFRHIAQGKLHKMIQDAGYGNSLHKREKHIARRIRKKLQEQEATIALAYKGKTIVITHKTAYDDKINQFLTDQDNANIAFLDLTLHRNETNITIDIYRKPTTTSTVIHSNSNHPQ
jgi:hypothetical protein